MQTKTQKQTKNAYNKLLKVTLLVATIFFYFLSIWADINSTSFPCFVSNPLKRLQSRYYLHRVDEKAEIQIDNEACPGSWSLESSSVRMQSLSSSSFFPPTYWVRTWLSSHFFSHSFQVNPQTCLLPLFLQATPKDWTCVVFDLRSSSQISSVKWSCTILIDTKWRMSSWNQFRAHLQKLFFE